MLPKTAYPTLLAVLAACVFWACQITGSKPENKEVITVLVADSLVNYDTVMICLLKAGTADTLEWLWNARLDDPSQLRRLPTRYYGGGPVDVLIQGRKAGRIRYRVRVLYRDAAAKPEKIDISPNDSDQTSPILFLNDTLPFVYRGSPYRDGPVACQDDLDGSLAVTVSGSVDTSKVGFYTLTYYCADKAGNQAAKRRRVVEVRLPKDINPPRVVLNGQDTVEVTLPNVFQDPGAICVDDRDTLLEPKIIGSVKDTVPGLNELDYVCTDSSGNKSAPKKRIVRVLNGKDTTAPILRLKGREILRVPLGNTLGDTGAVCTDGRDGALPVRVSGTADSAVLGSYQLEYFCVDLAGNANGLSQTVQVIDQVRLKFTAETTIDTLDLVRNPNQGFSGVLGFTAYPTDRYVTLVKAGLSRVRKTGLKSALMRFYTYGAGTSGGFSASAMFRINLLHSAWVEGTGNWYWAGGGWLNNGEALYANYPLADSIKAKSVDALAGNGVTPSDKALARAQNLTFLSAKQVALNYSDTHSQGVVPLPNDLVIVEMDITDYVKNTDPAQEFGFLITVEGVPAGKSIAFLTKEMGDGSYAPELVLSY